MLAARAQAAAALRRVYRAVDVRARALTTQSCWSSSGRMGVGVVSRCPENSAFAGVVDEDKACWLGTGR